jgi:protein phosphatase 2C family protein 2/3
MEEKNAVTFFKKNLHENLFSSDEFPLNPLIAIYQAYEKTELDFESIAFDKENKKLLDKSGSCALSALIIDEWCFITYLGDSRAIYSFDSGKSLYQVTRDHKPNDNVERARIIKAGGKIYKDTRLKVDGLKVRVNEKDAPGFKFPYRVSPGNLAVSIYIIFNLYFIRLQEALEI